MSERNNEIMNNENEVMNQTTNNTVVFTAIKYGGNIWNLPETDTPWSIEDVIDAAKQLTNSMTPPVTDSTDYTVGEGGVVTFIKPTQSGGTKGIIA